MLAISAMGIAGTPAPTEGIHHDWYAPRAAAFAVASAALTPAVQVLCEATPSQADASLQQARRHWLDVLAAWERLAGVAIGPVLERRSQRQIDFTPTRPRMIEKAIKATPKSAADMELIGTPAKGLPALEWLLWTQPVAPGTPACAYAVRVAEDIRREAEVLRQAKPGLADAQTLLSELVNQWVGGIERLRWPGMEMPVRVAATSATPVEPDFPRRSSGAAPLAWAAQWRALRELAMTGDASLAGALRARGHAALADALTGAVREADSAMQALETGDRERILAAAKRLAALKKQVENDVAPALGVTIGFSDADGD
ncbi:MAG: imelysin family protein [Hydrogenophilales bacterium]|nr:imelysin family protein [Hydrogenophilales bacterium]